MGQGANDADMCKGVTACPVCLLNAFSPLSSFCVIMDRTKCEHSNVTLGLR